MKYYTLIIGLLICSVSCINPSKEYVDSSNTPAEAVEAGAPSLEKDWTFDDYKNLNIYLGTLSENAYPKLGSSKSKDIFSKIITSVDLSIIKSPTFPLNEKVSFVLALQQEILNILNRYLLAHNNGIDYSMELSHLMGICLQSSEQIITLISQIIPMMDPNAEDYAIRMEGLDQMKSGLAMQLDGTLTSLQEVETYSDEERLILTGYLAEHASALINFLKPSVKREIEVKFEKCIENERNKEIKNILIDVLGLF